MTIPKTEDLRRCLGALAGAVHGPRRKALREELEALHRDVEVRDPRETIEAARRLLPQVAKLNSEGRDAVERFRNSVA